MSARTPLVPGTRGVWFGVAGVAILLAIATLTGMSRRQDVPPLHSADAVLGTLAPINRAAPAAVGPDLGGVPPAAASRAAQRDVDVRWRAELRPVGRTWQATSAPLPRESVAILAASDAPRGMAFRYGAAMLGAMRMQDDLGIRDVVSQHAIKADAEARTALAAGLQRQAACLAGVDLGAVYGRTVLTQQRVRGLLDLGLVRGTRDPSLDAAFLRGSRSGRPAECRVF